MAALPCGVKPGNVDSWFHPAEDEDAWADDQLLDIANRLGFEDDLADIVDEWGYDDGDEDDD